jgi:hypothetical protein
MSKRVPFTIGEMKGAREGMDDALQRAITLMAQKDADEATVTISINIIKALSGAAKVTYKSSVRVPMELKDAGNAADLSRIEWDEDLHAFVMVIDGEQVKME